MRSHLCKDAENLPTRTMDFALHVAEKDVGAAGEFEGYASVFNVVDQGGDAVQPGAFIEDISKAKKDGRLIPMLWQHQRDTPIGKWLDLSEDSKGLYVKGRLLIGDGTAARPGLAAAKEAHQLLLEKAIGGLSIGYRPMPGAVEEDPKRRGVWLLKKLSLIEVSLVTLPMLIPAKVTAVKNLIETGALPTVRELEGVLREVGFAPDLAKAIASGAKPLLEREAESGGEVDATKGFWDALGAGLKSATA